MTYDSDHDVGIKLDDPEACAAELQRCSNGMAQLTQESVRNDEAMAEVKDQFERVEAILAAGIRDEADAKLTATEVKGRITELMVADTFFAQARENLYTLEAEAESLERRLRTLEKRGGFAQSALNKHQNESRVAGFTGGAGV